MDTASVPRRDGERRIVDANAGFVSLLGRARGTLLGRHLFEFVADGPLATPREWRDALAEGRFSGEAALLDAGGREVHVQWGATTEVATGRRLVLFVVLSTSRWGARFRRSPKHEGGRGSLSAREREIVRLVAFGDTSPEIAAQQRRPAAGPCPDGLYIDSIAIYTWQMAKHLIDLDEDALGAARAELGTTTIRDTVNTALRLAAAERQRNVTDALDVLAATRLDDRADAWR
ncbi:MAG TPA: PAS domain-containing protein [Solirubrobacter sp.]|nr:PAS domain-containing protein [Solirubrobacter sp.]